MRFFRLRIPFLCKFAQTCQFKLKFDNLNSVVVFTFSACDWNSPFWANLVEKIKNDQFKLKFGAYINLNMQN